MNLGSAISVDFCEYTSSDGPSNPSQWIPVSSPTAIADRIDSFRLVTWNIWFDKLEKNIRNYSILRELFSIPSVDVIALQEVTSYFLELVQKEKIICSEWIITDYRDTKHRRGISENWYGNIFLVRKKWAGNIRGWVKGFPTSSKGRFIEILEIFQGDTSVV